MHLIEACLAAAQGRPTGGRQQQGSALPSVMIGNAAVSRLSVFRLALPVAIGLIVGCSSERGEQSPPIPLPKIEIPEQASEVASTETTPTEEPAVPPAREAPPDDGQ